MHSHSVADPQRPSSITALVKALRDNTHLSTAQATRLLADLEIRAVDLAPWNDFQHGVRASYGRVLLDRGANFELMLMSWAPGDYSAIHDHGSAEWVPYGISVALTTSCFPMGEACFPSMSE